jgi:hypothetical protein
VLTGGNLYLAHTLATATRWRGQLACVWLAVLLSSGSLVVPLIAGGLGGRPLHQMLGSERLQWAWAVLAALAHEVTAAGCMLAAAAARATGTPEHVSTGLSLLPAAASAGAALASAAQPTVSAALPLLCRAGCGRSFSSAASELGHLRHCPARQAQPRSRALSEPT